LRSPASSAACSSDDPNASLDNRDQAARDVGHSEFCFQLHSAATLSARPPRSLSFTGHLTCRRAVASAEIDHALAGLRVALLKEAVGEFVAASERGDLVGIADALADIVMSPTGWL
jgi:hypothetical protein